MALVVLILGACGPMFDCADTVRAAVPSPDGKYIVTVYERDCGATTNFSTQVNLRRKGQSFDGNRDQVFIADGRFEVKVAWKSNGALLLDYRRCPDDKVFKDVRQWEGIVIESREGPAAPDC